VAKVAAASNCSRCDSGSYNVRLAVTTIIPAKMCAQIKYPTCCDFQTDEDGDGDADAGAVCGGGVGGGDGCCWHI